jgi:hypothetical protein
MRVVSGPEIIHMMANTMADPDATRNIKLTRGKEVTSTHAPRKGISVISRDEFRASRMVAMTLPRRQIQQAWCRHLFAHLLCLNPH